MTAQLKHCSQHPKCKGPTLIPDHATSCPDGSGPECDNDTCWLPCPYCVTDENKPRRSFGVDRWGSLYSIPRVP